MIYLGKHLLILLAIYLLHRVEELTSDCLKLKESNDALQIDLAKQIQQNENFKKVMFSLFLPCCLSLLFSLTSFVIHFRVYPLALMIQKSNNPKA